MFTGSQNKPRLFVDMDGTLAEWRPISLKIENDEDRFIVLSKLNEILLTPGYYESLKPNTNLVNAINRLVGTFDIYILSCAIEKEGIPNPAIEKRKWLDKYLPGIDEKHRIFVPDGKNKADYIPEGIKRTDYLLDDFTKNLLEFKEAGGEGIKALNLVNGNYGKWTGNSINIFLDSETISENIYSIITCGKDIKNDPPEKISAGAVLNKDTDVNDILNEYGLN